MLESFESGFIKWKAGADLPDWIAETGVFEVALVLALFIVLLGISKLARSVEVNSDGKVIVRYYSPLRWPARYAEFIQKERARYTPNQRRWFSFFYRGKNWLEAIFFLLLGLLIGGAGVFLVFMEPGSIFSPYPAGLLVVGVLLIAYAWRSFRTVDKGNPFNINND